MIMIAMRNVLVALAVIIGLSTIAVLVCGCHDVDQIDELDELDEETSAPLIDDSGDDNYRRYWLVIEHAYLDRSKTSADDWRPDPVATIYRDGDVMGSTAGCVMDTWDPVWEDHAGAYSVLEWSSDAWSIIVTDWQREPTANTWLGACDLDVAPGEIEHELFLILDDCEGAVVEIGVKFERVDGDVDTSLERDPTC